MTKGEQYKIESSTSPLRHETASIILGMVAASVNDAFDVALHLSNLLSYEAPRQTLSTSL